MSVQSVERTFSIIEFLSRNAAPQPLSTIARACELPPATTHRLLDTLVNLGYIHSGVGGFYSMTPKLFSMSSNVLTNNNVMTYIRPHLQSLSDLVNESVHLVMRENTNVVYVDKVVKSIGTIQMSSHIGMKLPMYCTASGKAILSALSDSEVSDIFNKSSVHSITPNTITSLDCFLEDLQRVRQNGYAIDHEENELGITCIAMPLGKLSDDNTYAFSVSSLSARMGSERLAELAVFMRNTQSNILKKLIL